MRRYWDALPAGMWVLYIGMLAVIAIATILFALGLRNAAWFASFGGPLLVVGSVFVYVVGIDSKQRWPGVSAWERAGRVLSFYRD